MKPDFYAVHPALRPFVSHIMVVQVQLAGPAYSRVAPFPPTPQHSLNFYPADATKSRQGKQPFAELPACTIVGPQTTKVELAMGPQHRFVTVAFHPGGLFQLLRVPMHELLDVPLNAADILGRDISEVSEQLKAASHSLEMKGIVEAYLLRKMKPAASSPFVQAARLMMSGSTLSTIDQAAAFACLSTRQFERKAKEVLGYSPRLFARIIRFSKAYRLKLNQPDTTWTAISYQCGYYDQMHLIRDFKEFTATTPTIVAQEMRHSPLKVQDDLRM
ncbi:AraC family transcriptional regulator [Hymenobacter sp. BT186]|uniref:AraC family transcriptional regulator n=1 Tax=Hymenobacter telluris TaxID=2816474 RepID=A0A939EUD0_9BACT|nr:helix-turn-helix domain-containing protein [Hymenobacter telluris]MBO0356855.1 AraC family transcriptional regulator [Hymenobacter telluris]MBW3372881.1 helix-turn-helix domain-containing protein [Hymenobacter norwichensis]